MANTTPEYSRVCFTNNSGGVPRAIEDAVDEAKQIATAIRENPRNSTIQKALPVDSLVAHASPSSSLSLAITTSTLWKPGRELNVHFKAGTTWQQDKVKAYAPLWSSYANIKFTFDPSTEPNILVDFNPYNGSWSVLGTNSIYQVSGQHPSMNLGWIVDSKTEADIRQVVLHEFGHALGAIHEHTSPFAKIAWNKEQIYKDLGGPPNMWDQETVDRNMFTVYDAAENPSTAFDPASIMLYQYPTSWTLDNKGTAYNTELSEQDKSWIAFCYPKDEYDAAHFNTLQLQHDSSTTPKSESIVYLYKKLTTPPSLLYGLNWLDIKCGTDIRVKALAQNIQNDRFTASLATWDDTKLTAAGMTYLEVPRFPFTQSGVFSTEEVRPYNQPRAKTSKRITFANLSPFSDPPSVVCFFTALDMADGHDWHAKVYASDIDVRGFTINIVAASDAVLYTSSATWLACPPTQPKVALGRFSTVDCLSDTNTTPRNSSNEGGAANYSMAKQWGKHFDKTPKVFMALDEIHFRCGEDLSWRVSLSDVSARGLTWHLQTWGKSVMKGSGASFFAWEEAL